MLGPPRPAAARVLAEGAVAGPRQGGYQAAQPAHADTLRQRRRLERATERAFSSGTSSRPAAKPPMCAHQAMDLASAPGVLRAEEGDGHRPWRC
jgi:hypothetical protein